MSRRKLLSLCRVFLILKTVDGDCEIRNFFDD